MRKNNFKDIIKNKKVILIFIIVIVIIAAVSLFILFADNKQKPDNDIENQTEVNEEVNENTNNSNDEDLQKEETTEQETIPNDLNYTELEGSISEAAIMYVFDNYSFMENTITEEISLSVLVDNNYIKDETILKLYNDGICDAYSIVKADAVEIGGKAYLKCGNYTSEGYDENHLKK